jgi:hypothetical protein
VRPVNDSVRREMSRRMMGKTNAAPGLPAATMPRGGPSSSASIVQLPGTASRPPSGRRFAMASPA